MLTFERKLEMVYCNKSVELKNFVDVGLPQKRKGLETGPASILRWRGEMGILLCLAH